MIYLDNSATTALSPAAKEKMTEAMEIYGNPSSLHEAGVAALRLLNTARKQVAAAMGVRDLTPGQLVFTSCGTEADSLALFGTTHAKTRRTAHRIVSTDSEHPAIENALKALEIEGWEVVRIPTRGGILDMEAVDKALNADTFLVTMMMTNNETGARYDIESVFRKARARNPEVITHTDAVQGFLKERFSPEKLGADLVSVSSHKIHGPKGVGALYINPDLIKRKKIVPFLLGGGQEDGFRSGTENIIGIAGFGAAAADGASRLSASLEHMRELRDFLAGQLAATEVRANLPVGKRAPHILNLTLPDIKSETMVHALSGRGICVSAGSACASHGKHMSASLLGFGMTPHEADCSMRVSLSEDNTEEDINAFVVALKEELATLIRTPHA